MVVGLDYNLPYGPAASTVASRRIFPYYTTVNRQLPMGNSLYNAMFWKVEKRLYLFTVPVTDPGELWLEFYAWARASG